MLTGARPYSANTAYEWIILHMNATPPNLQDYGVGPQLARVVKRMLSGRPELRQQTMREVIQDLRTASRGLKNVHAFATEGTAVVASGGLTTDILSAPAAMPSPIPAPAQQPAPAPPSTSYPPPAAAPPPSYQPPSYQPPAPAPPPSYPSPPPSYPSPPAYGSGAAMTPPAAYPPAYQPGSLQGPTNPGQQSRLRRLAEFSFGALVLVVYLIFNWSETVGFFHRFLESLKFKGTP